LKNEAKKDQPGNKDPKEKKNKKGNNTKKPSENKNNVDNKPQKQNQNKNKEKKTTVAKTEPEPVVIKKVKKPETPSNKRAYQVSTLDKKMLKTVANKTKKEKKQWYESEEVQYAGIGVACFLVVMVVYSYIFSQ